MNEDINLLSIEYNQSSSKKLDKLITNQEELEIYRYGVSLLNILFTEEELIVGRLSHNTIKEPLDFKRINLLKGIFIYLINLFIIF